METPLSSTTLKIGAVLNTASGTCDETSESQMQEIFKELGITPTHIWCGGSEELTEAFEEMDTHMLDVLVVLGGDGTIRTAAARSTHEGPYLLPLPGGTMNILPKALYGNDPWQEVLKKTLTNPVAKQVSGGEVNGEKFFITSIFGAPALWAEVRESLRAHDLGRALEQGKIALDTMFAAKINYTLMGAESGEVEALSITCPLVAETLADTWHGFEAAVIDVHDVGEVLGLATTAAFGSWREDKNIQVVRTSSAHITSGKNIPAILDGETVELGNDINVTFIPQAFRVLVPATHEVLS
jgi:diacylglycerol kinase family enzyme